MGYRKATTALGIKRLLCDVLRQFLEGKPAEICILLPLLRSDTFQFDRVGQRVACFDDTRHGVGAVSELQAREITGFSSPGKSKILVCSGHSFHGVVATIVGDVGVGVHY